MDDLNDYYYFAAVVSSGGFASASRNLKIPRSKLSSRVSRLEGRAWPAADRAFDPSLPGDRDRSERDGGGAGRPRRRRLLVARRRLEHPL